MSRVVLITGSTQNLGLTMAEYFADRGDTVVVNGRDPAGVGRTVAVLTERGGRAIAGTADIGDPEAVERMVADVTANVGPVEVLIHNATLRRHGPIAEFGFADWQNVLATILTGGFLCARAVVPGMVERGGGRVVFIGGHSGQSGAAGGSATVAAKSGLMGLTKALAKELAPHGITVNCVSPGVIRTDRDPQPGSPRAEAAKRIPLGRMGSAAEVAAVCHFVCGPEAGYLTGQVIGVNGGLYT